MTAALPAPLSAGQWARLLSFIGYGNLAAPYWFIGMEEGRDPSETPASRLACQLQLAQVADLRTAHLEVFRVTKYHRDVNPELQSTWGTMCKIVLGLKGVESSPARVKEYQAMSLGRPNGETLLAELLPIASPGASQWDYVDLLPEFPRRSVYQAAVLPGRIRLFRELVGAHKPQVVICYGKSHWSNYRHLFPATTWSSSSVFQLGGSPAVALTPHFVPYQMSGERIESKAGRADAGAERGGPGCRDLSSTRLSKTSSGPSNSSPGPSRR